MDHDEGRRVSRRRLLTGVSSVGLSGLLAACGGQGTPTVVTSTGPAPTPPAVTPNDLTRLFQGANTCTLTPTTTSGPYYFDADKIRTDIREDRQGTRLRLAIKVQDSEACTPVPNAVVEIWHCDAAGLYSGAEALSANGGGEGAPNGGAPPPPTRTRPPAPSGAAPPSDAARPSAGPGAEEPAADLKPADEKRYLRGAQVTNADGIVEFVTIWPGWYRGRTVHVHAMVHVNDARALTTQLMFDERLNDRVYAARPYEARTGRDTTNGNDRIFDPSMLLKITQEGDGWLGVIILSADSDKDGA